jgi:hypothetical protein
MRIAIREPVVEKIDEAANFLTAGDAVGTGRYRENDVRRRQTGEYRFDPVGDVARRRGCRRAQRRHARNHLATRIKYDEPMACFD